MSWLTLLAEILKALGPLVRKWLDDKLKVKAAEFEARGLALAGKEPDSAALFRAVRGDLWFFERRRRAYLDAMIEIAPPVVSGRLTFSESTLSGLSALALAAN